MQTPIHHDSRVAELLVGYSSIQDNRIGDEPPVIIGWTFRTEDCLTCQDFQTELRHIIAKHGEEVQFVAVHIGDRADSLLATTFFRRERLNPHLIHLTASDYRKLFGSMPIPALYVVVNQKLLQATFENQALTKQGEVLEELIDKIL